MLDDEPLFSPRRLWFAFWEWCYWVTRDPMVELPFWKIMRYYHRPEVSDRDGWY